MRVTYLIITLLTLSVVLMGCSDTNSDSTVTSSTTSDQPTKPLSDVAVIDEKVDEVFSVLIAGTEVGKLKVEHKADEILVDFEFRNNGRGPSIKEQLRMAENGLPGSWAIEGSTTFGNKVDENFVLAGTQASWKDTTGEGSTTLEEPTLYVAQEASPYAVWVYAQALLSDADHSMPVLPGGTLRIDSMQLLKLKGKTGEISATAYALSGLSLNPTYFLLDDKRALLAIMSPSFALILEGYEGEDERLRALATEYSAKRFEKIQEKVAHNYDRPVRIKNVRIFDPATEALGEPVSVIVAGNKIEKIISIDTPAVANEVVIDGAGGTVVAGMYEMHGHLGQNRALLNIAAGVTSVRDMGNNNEVLSELIDKIETGRLAGPRVTRSGFIEGKSEYSSNNGILVSTEEEAVAAVREYSNGEFHQIKIYNSMNPEWVPAMIAEARAQGLKVTGHVPAFSNADAMIAAGYDELTHINQVMLGWVLDEGEDTRTLLRLTALRRLPALEMDDPKIIATIDAMAAANIAIDPTLAIHETLLRSRNGAISPGTVDFIEHMPVGVQRSAKTAWADIATPEDDKAYWSAFDKIIETITLMRDKGIMLLPGTDLGGSFYYHRELELYQLIGMTPAEILKWATYDMAAYLGQEEMLGSIEAGKYADFFLIPGDPTKDLKAIKTISMVVKNGTFYFPSEIYPEFGISPFIQAPQVLQ